MKKLIAILVLFFVIIFFPFQSKFTISNGNNDEIVYIGNIEDYRTFHISFIHSVNRTPVLEFYRIVDDNLVLYKAEFYSYGAGMSDGSDLPNSKLSHGEHGLVILDFNDEFEELTYYVGTIANHTLHFGDKELMLTDILEPQSPAVFAIKKVSIYSILRGA